VITAADYREAMARFATGVVNVLGPDHEELAARFGTGGAEKFAGNEFRPGRDGLPILRDALVSLRCRTVELAAGGDHTILIARVEDGQLRREGQPAVHVDRRYWDLVPREGR
jgi:flavin reductase ActVB